MTTQYTPILKLALPVQGELSGTWGDVVNDNITSMVEQAIAGLSVVNTWTTNSHVLTTANGTTAESRAAMLSLTDSGTALTGAGSVICPALSKVYIVKNGTAQVITVKTAAGSGIAVPVGKTMLVYCDGTNVLEAVDHVVTLSAGTLTITGLTTFASLKGTGAVTVTNILDEDNMASDSATALATQQSIKAYVDSQVGTVDTLSEILAIGNTSGANNLIIDNGQAITTNTINETTAASGVTIDSVLLKDDGVNATNLEITNIKANDGTSAGSIADSTGVVTLASSVLTTADINGGTIDGTTIGATTPASVAATTGTFSGAGSFNTTANDAVTANTSFATPTTLGLVTLKRGGVVKGYLGLSPTEAGAALLNSAGAVRVEANATGIDVTGTVTADGLTVDGAGTFSRPDNENLFIADTTNTTRSSFQVSSDITFFNGNIDTASHGNFVWRSSNAYTERMRIDASGNVGIGTSSPQSTYKLTISGTDSVFPSVYLENTTNSKAYSMRATGTSWIIRDNTVGADRLNIDTSGNVGIGTAAPESIVHIKDTGNVTTTLQIEGAATGYAPVINFDGIVAGNADYLLGEINGSWDTHTNVVSAIRFESGADTTNKDDGLISFWTSSSGPTLEERMRIDISGNLGLGVVPSAWGGTQKSLQLPGNSVFAGGNDVGTIVGNNMYWDGSAYKYIATAAANMLQFSAGSYLFRQALSGTAGNPITFTTAMTLDASGNLTTTGAATFGGNVIIPAASVLYFDGGGDTFMREVSPNIVQVNTAGAVAMTIDATQNVTIEGYVYPNSGIYLRRHRCCKPAG
jgi:hypothetical protein